MFSCEHCLNTISQNKNIYMGYDMTFCSRFCRENYRNRKNEIIVININNHTEIPNTKIPNTKIYHNNSIDNNSDICNIIINKIRIIKYIFNYLFNLNKKFKYMQNIIN